MHQLLERHDQLTLNQWMIVATANLGDMLDFFLIGYGLAFIVDPRHLTFGQSAIVLVSSGLGAVPGAFFWGWTGAQHDHPTTSGGGMASAAAGERHGVRLRRRQPGQDPRAARARADRRLIQLGQPAGNRRSDLSRFPLSHVLVRARRLRILAVAPETKGRSTEEIDKALRRVRDPYGHLNARGAAMGSAEALRRTKGGVDGC
jgi:hypothetical protein